MKASLFHLHTYCLWSRNWLLGVILVPEFQNTAATIIVIVITIMAVIKIVANQEYIVIEVIAEVIPVTMIVTNLRKIKEFNH